MVGIIRVSNRNCLGGFTDSFQLREVEMDMEDKRNGKLIEYGIEKLEDAVKNPRPLIDKVCKSWREELAFNQSKYKTKLNFKEGKFNFVLSFITWHSMFLTGKIIIEK